MAGKVTAGLTESNDSQPLGLWPSHLSDDFLGTLTDSQLTLTKSLRHTGAGIFTC